MHSSGYTKIANLSGPTSTTQTGLPLRPAQGSIASGRGMWVDSRKTNTNEAPGIPTRSVLSIFGRIEKPALDFLQGLRGLEAGGVSHPGRQNWTTATIAPPNVQPQPHDALLYIRIHPFTSHGTQLAMSKNLDLKRKVSTCPLFNSLVYDPSSVSRTWETHDRKTERLRN